MAREPLHARDRSRIWKFLTTERFCLQVGLALLVLLVVLWQSYPLTFWEFDELLFGAGVLHYDPFQQHPHAPGFPVFIGLAKALNIGIDDPFTSLVVLSGVSSLVGFLALTLAFRNLLRDDRLGIFGALLFYLSPGMLVHATLPLSDPAALALLALTFYSASKVDLSFGDRDAILFGLTASLTVGCRPQLAILIVPLIAFVILWDGSWRRSTIVLIAFAVVSMLWLLPLIVSTGGLSGFTRYQVAQASDFAVRDVDLARSGRSWANVLFRFVAHLWGPKQLSGPVLLCAAVGFAVAARRVETRLFPLLGAAGVYLLVAVTIMDPADGVRYGLPAGIGTALLAARGVGWLARQPRWTPAILIPIVLWGAGSIVYVHSLISQRHTSASPPVQAARYARQSLPGDTVILYEAPLFPHAKQLLSSFRSTSVSDGLDEYSDWPDVPLYLFADGGSDSPLAKTFSWVNSDAYGKLTRNYYRVVSLVPVAPTERYRAIRGLYAPERVPGERQSWRWLGSTAEIALPDLGAKIVIIGFGLPADYPLGSNSVKILVNGAPGAQVTIRPGQPTEATIDLPAGRAMLSIESEKSFVPAKIPNSRNRDRRELGVRLLFVEQRR